MTHSKKLALPFIQKTIFPLLTLAMLLPGWEAMASGGHSIVVPSEMTKKVSPEAKAGMEKFFHSAELAISKGDLDALMGLYSADYKNEDHDKAAAREIWKRIFGTFEKMSTMHNMKLLNYSAEGKLAVIGCSGILLGVKKSDGSKLPVDTWTNEEHILVNEGGLWKLIGSSGMKRKRLWFDKPMHPLF